MDALLLEPFFHELERRFGELPPLERPTFGIDERLRCERVVRLPGPWSMYRLRESLRACLVRRPAQGVAFEQAFNTAFGIEREEDLQTEPLPPRTDTLGPKPPERPPEVRRRRIIGAVGLLAVLGGAMVALHLWPDDEPVIEPPQADPPQVLQPEPDLTETPNTDPFATWKDARRTSRLEATFTPGRDPRGAIAAALAAAAGVIVLGTWRWKRRVDAERLPKPEPPELAEQASLVSLTVDLPRAREELLDRVAADQLADAVGIILDVPVRPDLDVHATIRETARRAGFPSPVLAGERHLQRVIVLGHAASPARRERPLDVEIAEKLAARGVPAWRAELRPGSTQVFPKVGTPTSLDRLHQNDAAAIVIVVGEPDRLEKELLRQLATFKRVAVVVPLDPGIAEPRRIALPVFHPTGPGWRALAEWVRQGVAPQDRPLALLEPRVPPPRAMESLGAGRALGADEQHELEHFLGPALPWAAALACLPLPAGPGLVQALRRVVVDLARAEGLPDLAERLEALRPTAVDRLHAMTGTGPGDTIDLPGPVREWLWTKILDGRWPGLHEALLRHHLVLLDGLALAPGSQEALDRDFARLVLRAWLARMSRDEAEVIRVATALRDFRHGARTADQAQVWREALIPRPQGDLSPAAARLVTAAWTDVEWEPWTARRRAAGLAALAGAVAACAGGVVIATTQAEPTIQVEGGYLAWWQDGWMAVRDGAFTQTGLVQKPAAGVSGTLTFERVEDPNGPPCVEYEEPDVWWVRCGPGGHYMDKNRYEPGKPTEFRVVTGSLEAFLDPRVPRVLDWMFAAGKVQGAYVGAERSDVVRQLLGWDGTFDQERLVGARIPPAGAGSVTPMATGESLTAEAESLLTGRWLPFGTVELACVEGAGVRVECRVLGTFGPGPGVRRDGADVALEAGAHSLAAGTWSLVVEGHEETRQGVEVVEGATQAVTFQLGAPVARATLKLGDGLSATMDGVAWNGKVRELGQGLHKLEVGPGCPPATYDVVVGDGEAPKGAIRLKAGVEEVQAIRVEGPALREFRLRAAAADLEGGPAFIGDVVRLDGSRFLASTGRAQAELSVATPDIVSGTYRAPLTCGEHTVDVYAADAPGRAGGPSIGSARIVVTDKGVGDAEARITFTVPKVVESDTKVTQTVVVDTTQGQEAPPPPRPKPCDGGALPTGGPTGATINVNLKGFNAPMKFVVLSGGNFAMGSPPDEEGRDEDETCHRVSLSAFAIATTEVSQAQWKAVMGENPSVPAYAELSLLGDSLPVQNISWCDSIEFANRLSEQTGRAPAYELAGSCRAGGRVTWLSGANGFRLPTESQWEYAARGGTSTAWGDTNYASVATASHRIKQPNSNPSADIGDVTAVNARVYRAIVEYGLRNKMAMSDAETSTTASPSSHPPTAEVIYKQSNDKDSRSGCCYIGPWRVDAGEPNSWGIHNAVGNVWEWTWDTVRPHSSLPPAQVIRGGSWATELAAARVAYRGYGVGGLGDDDRGLRLALPPP